MESGVWMFSFKKIIEQKVQISLYIHLFKKKMKLMIVMTFEMMKKTVEND